VRERFQDPFRAATVRERFPQKVLYHPV